MITGIGRTKKRYNADVLYQYIIIENMLGKVM